MTLKPLPEKLTAISKQHRRYDTDNWSIHARRHKLENTLVGHLTFSLNYEGIDLAILNTLFNTIDYKEIEKIVV